jgi:hypothetical protein
MNDPKNIDATLGRLCGLLDGVAREIAVMRGELAGQQRSHVEDILKLHQKIEGVQKDSGAIGTQLADMQGTLKGGRAVLLFFQALLFAAICWLFVQVSNNTTANAELRTTVAAQGSTLSEIKAELVHQNVELNQLNRRLPPELKETR